MNLINSEINATNFNNLFQKFHDLAVHENKQTEHKHFSVERMGKHKDIDIKINIKLYIIYKYIDENFSISTKIMIIPEGITLRKNIRYDYEHQIVDTTLCIYDRDYSDYINRIINVINDYRVCNICRIIFKDQKDMTCLNCMYDSIFSPKDIKCAICIDDLQIEDQSFSLTCGHIYHTKCILETFIQTKKRNCPICKEIDKHNI